MGYLFYRRIPVTVLWLQIEMKAEYQHCAETLGCNFMGQRGDFGRRLWFGRGKFSMQLLCFMFRCPCSLAIFSSTIFTSM